MKSEQIKYLVRILVLAVFVGSFSLVHLQNETLDASKSSNLSEDYWRLFAEITKEKRYIEEASAHYRIPVFTPTLLGLSGQEIKLVGYFLPYSKIDSMIILSRYPNASCFYCGQAGIESVAMVELSNRKGKFQTDQRLIATGKLTLNSTNINKLAFVIEDASVEPYIK